MLAYLGGSVTSNRGKSHSIKGTHCDIGVWCNQQSEKFIYIYIYIYECACLKVDKLLCASLHNYTVVIH